MIIELPILEPGISKQLHGHIPEQTLKNMDGMETNIPVTNKVNHPKKPEEIIGSCKKLFWKEGKLWARLELFDQTISVGYKKEEQEIDIQEIVLFNESELIQKLEDARPEDLNIERIYKD